MYVRRISSEGASYIVGYGKSTTKISQNSGSKRKKIGITPTLVGRTMKDENEPGKEMGSVLGNGDLSTRHSMCIRPKSIASTGNVFGRDETM